MRDNATTDFYAGSSDKFTVPMGVWSHIVCSCTNTGTINVYVNNIQVLTNINIPRFNQWTQATLTNCSLITNVGGPEPRTFNGSIDDFKLYNTVLTATQVAALYNNTAA